MTYIINMRNISWLFSWKNEPSATQGIKTPVFFGGGFFFSFKTRVLPYSSWPGTHYVDQYGLKLAVILLPLPPESWDYRCITPWQVNFSFYFHENRQLEARFCPSLLFSNFWNKRLLLKSLVSRHSSEWIVVFLWLDPGALWEMILIRTLTTKLKIRKKTHNPPDMVQVYLTVLIMLKGSLCK